MEFTPITEVLGATVTGVSGQSLTDPLVAADVAAALDRYSVLVMPGVDISDPDLIALSRHLGTVVLPPFGALADYPEIMTISRDPAINPLAAVTTANDYFHTDGTSYERPDKATFLAARRAPEDGEGDTEFAGTFAAYAALSDEMKETVAPLRVVHTFANAQRHAFPDPTEKQLRMWDRVAPREHPLVWRRDDGRASLLLGSTATSIVGMDEVAGRALIDDLNAWATQPRFVIRHRWSEGDLVIFDNTALLHRSCAYVPTSPRLMHRTTLVGELAVA